MRYFFDNKPGNYSTKNGCFLINETNAYYELIYKIDEYAYFIINIIPRNNNSIYVAACLDDMIDVFTSKYTDDKEKEEMRNKCPLMMKLLNNGTQHKFSEGALIKLEDIDTGDTKWFLASIVGNLKLDCINDILCEQTLIATKIVSEKTRQLCNELPAKGPSKFKRYIRNTKEVLSIAIEIAAILSDTNKS